MPKRIAIVTPVFPPYRGGMGKVAETDARQLAALGHDVLVYAPDLKDAPRGKGGFATRRLPRWFRVGHAAFAPTLATLFRSHDLVALHYPFFGAAEPLAFLRPRHGKRAKLLLTYHMDVFGQPALRPFFALHAAQVMPRVVAAADRVIVTSEDYARSSRVAPLFAAHPERFRALAPGTDVKRFAPGPKDASLLERHGLSVHDRVITLVGGLDKAHYFKGVPTLLRAIASTDLSDTRLVIVGQGDLRPKYEEYARQLGVAGRVIFAGSVSEDELPSYHRLGDVFAFPSVDQSEAFGIAALEALASGVPVVSSDLPGVRTIVREGETGLRVPAGSASALAAALVRLLGNESMRRTMGEAARAMAVREFSLESRQAKLGKIVNEML